MTLTYNRTHNRAHNHANNRTYSFGAGFEQLTKRSKRKKIQICFFFFNYTIIFRINFRSKHSYGKYLNSEKYFEYNQECNRNHRLLYLNFQAKIKTDYCWNKIERFVGEKFPSCVKILLKKAGYDRLNSLSKIDTERISEIEVHLDNNREWANELKCCNSEYYKQLEMFHFLPGHKATILDIPVQIQQMRNGNIEASVKCVPTMNSSRNQRSMQRSHDDIIQGLVSNMLKYAKKTNFPISDEMISANNVNDFEEGDDLDDFAYKCRFSCPFCERVFPSSINLPILKQR